MSRVQACRQIITKQGEKLGVAEASFYEAQRRIFGAQTQALRFKLDIYAQKQR